MASDFRPMVHVGTVVESFGERYKSYTEQSKKTWYYSLVEYNTSKGDFVRLVATPDKTELGDKIPFANSGGVIYASRL